MLPASRKQDIPLPRNPNKPRYEDFVFQPKPRDRPQPIKDPEFEGWDTETVRDGPFKGRAFVLANSRRHFALGFRNHAIETHWEPSKPPEIEDLLRVLTHQGQGRINSWWNLDFDVSALFKWDHELLQELYPEKGATGEAEVVASDGSKYRLMYLRKKCLTIKHGNKTARHYDAFLFYQQTLAKAAISYLKREPPDLKSKRDEDLSLKNFPEVASYCRWDATAARDLMELFYSKLAKMNFYPRKPISAGYLAADFIRSRSDLPYVFDTPKWINEAAWEAFKGGWIDIWQRGTLKVWKYDINSAYPWAMREFPDLRDGVWTKELVPDAPIGFVFVRIVQSEGSIPALASWMKVVHGYPLLDRPVQTWITLPEYLCLKHCPGIQLEVLRAFSFLPQEGCRYPFLEPVDTLLGFKNQFHPKKGITPDPAAYLASKMIFNSLYGKSCERIRVGDKVRAGKIFNPVYAAMTTARTRVLIIEAIKDHLDSIVSISTDCIAATKPLPLPLHDEELGKWKVEAKGEVGTFVFPGIYEIGDDTTHSRGFRISTCVCGHESKHHITNHGCYQCQECPDFRPSLKRLIRENTNQNGNLEIRYERPWKTREAIRASDLDLVGVFEKRLYEKQIDTVRRLWLRKPTTFRDLLDNNYRSVPIPLSWEIAGRGLIEREQNVKAGLELVGRLAA